jgi:hypothetical protein
LTPPEGLKRLTKDYPIWLDTKRKLLVVDGEVCLREGQLEMFACPRQTKEHESIVAIDAPARFVHAGLLAIGARAGKPVRFDPKYTPASGDVINITLLWQNEDGKRQKARAQEWVRDVKTKKPLAYDWVFAGSGFWKDPDTGEAFYHGDAGDFICVSNFPSATMDLPVESPQATAELLFEAFTERIPPRGTPVRLVLEPRRPADAEKADEKKADAEKADAEKADAEPSETTPTEAGDRQPGS